MERLALGLGRYLPVYRTYTLGSRDAQVERAVVVVHGTYRNADGYFATMVATLQAAGDLSASDSPLTRISSFAAMDALLQALADPDRFPGLKSIVVTGHSAGGQFTHRYAGSSPIPELLRGIPVRFVIANPSTYLWLGPERPAGDGFARPDSASCPTWNDWPYGTSNRNSCARATDDPGIRFQLTTRDVRMLVGDADTLTAYLDVSCPANLQGRRRYDRGRALMLFMDLHFPGHRHRESVIPGVGHSSRDMYGSTAGTAALVSW